MTISVDPIMFERANAGAEAIVETIDELLPSIELDVSRFLYGEAEQIESRLNALGGRQSQSKLQGRSSSIAESTMVLTSA